MQSITDLHSFFLFREICLNFKLENRQILPIDWYDPTMSR